MKATDFAPAVLDSPLALMQYLSHNRQEEGGKKKKGERKNGGEMR